MQFQNQVVYQIYPKSFQDSNGDGIGDLGGIRQRLAYLAKLGVDYLWLNPIYPSPNRDNGYDVSDYRNIAKEYGDLAEFKLLCQEAAKYNLKIMLDMVFNHSSIAHAWFQKALAGEVEYQNYYIFKPGKRPVKEILNNDELALVKQYFNFKQGANLDELATFLAPASALDANLEANLTSDRAKLLVREQKHALASERLSDPEANLNKQLNDSVKKPTNQADLIAKLQSIQAKLSSNAPTNWQSKFGGSAWQYVPNLDAYYLHLYDFSQADLNWENKKVRHEIAAIINFWRDLGVKGFRFDVINLVSKAAYQDDPQQFDGRQFYTDGPKLHAYLHELNLASFGQDQEILTVGEMSSTTISQCQKYADPKRRELASVFNFHHLKVDYQAGDKWQLKDFDLRELKAIFFEWQSEMQKTGALNALFWCNHDQPRALSRFIKEPLSTLAGCETIVKGQQNELREKAAKLLATILHAFKGVPYIYQGEEIGMTNADFQEIADFKDVESRNYAQILAKKGHSQTEILEILKARSRDNARTPMQWDSTKYAGFSDQKSWLRVNANAETINVKSALADANSIFYYYQTLVKLRHELAVLQAGEFVPLLEEHPEIVAFKRELGMEQILLLANFSNHHVQIPNELTTSLAKQSWHILVTNETGSKNSSSKQKLGELKELAPYAAFLLGSESLFENFNLQ